MPQIQDLLDNLGGNKWCSILYQGRVNHQGFVSEESRHLTAFSTLWAIYEFTWIPFDLTNAPAAFQRCIEEVLEGIRRKCCTPQRCYSTSFEDHVNHRRQTLSHIREHEIKLKPTKCKLFKRDAHYLRHLVSGDGVKTDPQREVLKS